ncbi:hypothetical protein JCM8097_007488 [Rhodosporidiobolus ruineniae]
MTPPLPTELVDKITRFAAPSTHHDVRSHRQTCGRLSLISRAWRAPAQRLLFERLEVTIEGGDQGLKRMARRIHEGKKKNRAVRVLVLRNGAGKDDASEQYAYLVEHLESVEHLVLSGFFRYPFKQSAFPELHTLAVTHDTLAPDNFDPSGLPSHPASLSFLRTDFARPLPPWIPRTLVLLLCSDAYGIQRATALTNLMINRCTAKFHKGIARRLLRTAPPSLRNVYVGRWGEYGMRIAAGTAPEDSGSIRQGPEEMSTPPRTLHIDQDPRVFEKKRHAVAKEREDEAAVALREWCGEKEVALQVVDRDYACSTVLGETVDGEEETALWEEVDRWMASL